MRLEYVACEVPDRLCVLEQVSDHLWASALSSRDSRSGHLPHRAVGRGMWLLVVIVVVLVVIVLVVLVAVPGAQ